MTLEELLDNPEEIAKLSTNELKALLEPYFSLTRKPLLPPEKSKKTTVENQLILSMTQVYAKEIAAIRASRGK